MGLAPGLGMEHEFTPDKAAPWPGKADGAPAEEPAEGPTEPITPAAPQSPRRELMFGALVVVLAGAGTLAMLVSREAPPATTVAASTAVAAKAASAATPDLGWVTRAPRWTANHEAWLGRNTGAALEVSAAEPVGVWMRNVRPALVVRCVGRTAEVFVFTDSAAAIEPNTDEHTVSFAFDGEPPTTTRWPDGAEHNALFAPNGRELAARLMTANTFTFGFVPHNAGRVTARFNTAGLAALLKPAAKHCGTQ